MAVDETVSYRDSALPQIIHQYLERMKNAVDSGVLKSLSFSETNDLTSRVEDLLIEAGFEKKAIDVMGKEEKNDLETIYKTATLDIFAAKHDTHTYILSSEDLQYGNPTPCLYKIENNDLEGVLANFADESKEPPTLFPGIVSTMFVGSFAGGITGCFLLMLASLTMSQEYLPDDNYLGVFGGILTASIIGGCAWAYPIVRTGRRFLSETVVSKGEEALYAAIRHAPIRYRAAEQDVEADVHEEEVLADTQSLNTYSAA